MSLSATLQTIKVHLNTVEMNLLELEQKNRKTAAPRARKAIQECRKLLTELRKDITINVKAIPSTTRIPIIVRTQSEIAENEKLVESPNLEEEVVKKKFVKIALDKSTTIL